MKIQCAVCGIGISPFIQSWKDFLQATKGWKKFYCIGEPQSNGKHDFDICPKCVMSERCPICGNLVLSEREFCELNASVEDTGSAPRFY